MKKSTRTYQNTGKPAVSKALAALSVFLLACVCGCGGGDEAAATITQERSEKPRNVRIMTLARGDLAEYFTISGICAPVRGTVVSAEEGGVVAEVPRDKGAIAAEDETLVLLDRKMLAAQLESANAARELSAYNEDRTRRLFDVNSVSRFEMLQAETSLKQAETQEKIARLRYERAAVKAPFPGVVTGIYVEKGQLVSPGMPVARIADPYTLSLEGTVSETEVNWVEKGKPAVVTFDGFDRVVDGIVHWTGFEADPATGKFGVEIRIPNPDLSIRPGVVARARIRKALHQNVLTIPRDAVLQRSGRDFVYIDIDGFARATTVELGPGRGLLVVAEAGLEKGDRLIVRGHRDIRDGSAVAVREEADYPDGTSIGDPGAPESDHTPSKPRTEDPAMQLPEAG